MYTVEVDLDDGGYVQRILGVKLTIGSIVSEHILSEYTRYHFQILVVPY